MTLLETTVNGLQTNLSLFDLVFKNSLKVVLYEIRLKCLVIINCKNGHLLLSFRISLY